MSGKNLLYAVLMVIISTGEAYGQTTFTNGNLVRTGFNQKEAAAGDTLGAWKDVIGSLGYKAYTYSKYCDHFTTPLRGYFIKKNEDWWDSQYFVYTSGERFIEKDSSATLRRFGATDAGWDILEPLMIDRTIITETKNGYWLINGLFGNPFLNNNDTLSVFMHFYHSVPNQTMADWLMVIAGRVNDKYLAAFQKEKYTDSLQYYLVSLDDSPYIDPIKAEKVRFIRDNKSYTIPITDIRKLTDDLYAVKPDRSDYLDIYRFSTNTFYYLKTTMNGEFSPIHSSSDKWEYRNGKLYRLGNKDIASFEFRSSDTSFVNKKILLDSLYDSYLSHNSNFGVDRNFRYAAKIFRDPEKKSQDTLKIYDIDKEKFISSISLSSLKATFKPVIDSPYVYLHQITYQKTITGVGDDKEKTIKNYSLSAYPNPFNPATTISYSIPKQSHVELKIFDMLGREISTLISKEQSAGEYKVQFNGSSLSSGIYIYEIKAGEYRAGKKLLLLK